MLSSERREARQELQTVPFSYRLIIVAVLADAR